MTEKKSNLFVWKRKHKNSEDVNEGIYNIFRATLISLGITGAFLVTVLLSLHIELSAVIRNLIYGEPIIIKKPISVIRNVPIFYKDSIGSAPIIVDLAPQETFEPQIESISTTPIPSNVTKVGSYTYKVRIGSDNRMATPSEMIDALNYYRKAHGKSELAWDVALAEYAGERAKYFHNNQILDEHEGFRRFVNNERGFEKLGFNSLGENSAYLSGGRLMAKTIIEQLFASDIYHDSNQLDAKWSHVGIGIEGLAINIIFGGKKTN